MVEEINQAVVYGHDLALVGHNLVKGAHQAPINTPIITGTLTRLARSTRLAKSMPRSLG